MRADKKPKVSVSDGNCGDDSDRDEDGCSNMVYSDPDKHLYQNILVISAISYLSHLCQQ